MTDTIHVLPKDDIYPHTESYDCDCNPTVTLEGDGVLVVHNAWDGRDVFEELDKQGGGK